MDIKISPSILASDYANLESELKRIESSDMIHVDVMDGHFVPNISIGAPVVAAIKKVCSVAFDVHLMISNPLDYAEDFAKAGADIICFHAESNSDIYCSKSCAQKFFYKSHKVKRICAFCGKEFETFKHHPTQTCSLHCAAQLKLSKLPPRPVKICPYCGKEILPNDPHYKTKTFCSLACSNKARAKSYSKSVPK